MKATSRIVVALFILCALPAFAGTPKPRTMKRIRTIVLDPGHGGENMGALAVNGIYEKHMTLALSLLIEEDLKRRTDATVYLTRRDDRFLGLRERTRFANQVGADVFLSIHGNAEPGHKAEGIETFLLSAEATDEEAARLVEFENKRYEEAEAPTEEKEVGVILKDMAIAGAQHDAEPLAALVYEHIVKRTRARRRGVKQAPFGVLKEAEMPAIVVEVGFLSHPDEGVELFTEERQKATARGIVDALIAFDRSSTYR